MGSGTHEVLVLFHFLSASGRPGCRSRVFPGWPVLFLSGVLPSGARVSLWSGALPSGARVFLTSWISRYRRFPPGGWYGGFTPPFSLMLWVALFEMPYPLGYGSLGLRQASASHSRYVGIGPVIRAEG